MRILFLNPLALRVEPYMQPSSNDVFATKLSERNTYLDQMEKLNPVDPMVPLLRQRAQQHVLENMVQEKSQAQKADEKRQLEQSKISDLCQKPVFLVYLKE